MAYVDMMSRVASATTAALSCAHFLRRRAASPPSGLPLFPATLSAHILIKPTSRLRPSNAAMFSAAAGVGGAVLQDAGATALVVGGAYALVSTFDSLTRRNIIEQKKKQISQPHARKLFMWRVSCLEYIHKHKS